jgi:peroxiredoxin
MSRRTWIALVAPLLLVGAWLLVQALVRRHVDGVIQGALDKPLPSFVLADTTGKSWSTADLRGKRAVLHFFRSRCHSCDAEAPEIRALEQALPADVVMLHVMTDRVLDFPAELTTATLQQKGWQRPVLMADAKFMAAFHQVRWSQVTPITYIVDTMGVVRFGLRGAQTRAAIEQALAAAR